MTYVSKTYDEIVEHILSQITKGVVNEKHVYEPHRSRYRLANTPVKRIVKVEGLLRGSRHVFRSDIDYRLVDDMIEWLPGGDRPDDMTAFYVNYVFNDQPAITDVNPGSVVRTIVEAISREIEFLYAQLSHVYSAGFIDTASGSALDLVVSILGVKRKPAEHASGFVTFGRSSDPPTVQVSREAHIYDGKELYELRSTPVKGVVKVEGVVEGGSYEFKEGVDYVEEEGKIKWLSEGKKPDLNTTFYVDYLAYEKIRIPKGTRVSTYSRAPGEAKVYETTEERVLEKVAEGRWEADVPVRALIPGRAGNVYAGMITVMPKPLLGVEYVINREDILNGVDEESDEELRARAKRALEVAGRATLQSLEAAVRGVEGVSSVLVEDMPDGVPGVVRVIADGGDEEEIKRVIEEVRAAGIRVEFLRPKPVYLDVDVTVNPLPRADYAKLEDEVEARVRSYISSLSIGDDVLYNRIVEAVLSVEGVYDVEELTVKAHRREGATITSTRENIELASDERASARSINVLVKPLERRGGR